MTDLIDDDPASRRGPVSARAFSEASMLFCDRYALVGEAGAGHAGNADTRLFEGVLRTQATSSGINLSTADIVALGDSDHAVVFPKSVSIVVSLEGRPSEVAPGHGRDTVVLKQGEAALFSFSDEVETRGRYSLGHRSKSVLLQLRPDAVADDALLDFVHRRVQSGGIVSLGTGPRLNAISAQLFNPALRGVVGRLLTESHVLELVARAIQASGYAMAPQAAAISHTDMTRMARVRDMLIEQPGEPHTLQSLAREAGVSVSGLKVKFRQAYGKPVFVFLHDVRMETARTGLEFHGWTVAQAAHFTGYGHASNFATAFRKHFGCSPGRTGNGTIYPCA